MHGTNIGADRISVGLSKGQRTKLAILEAVIHCYQHYGYSKTTQEKIAAQAQLSMGALTYHFPSITTITQATIEYVYSERLRRHTELITTTLTDVEDFETALEIYWRETLDPLFIASLELGVAARTEDELFAVWSPAHQHFRERWRDNLLTLHPNWQGNYEIFVFAVEYSTHLFEGMAINTLLSKSSDCDLQRAIRDYLKDNLQALQMLAGAGGNLQELLSPGRDLRRRLLS
jgi:AcrR family transcriptional regulator